MHPIMLDVAGYELSAEDKEILAHPLVGGVILFARNYHDPAQLKALTSDMRKSAKKPIVIASDHEGGRVQRFRDGFYQLPAMYQLNQTASPQSAARSAGIIAAYECLLHGVDLALSPVLDINGRSQVIGDRAFGHDVETILDQASAFIGGLHEVGMASTGKHFPGHGSVLADTHVAQAIDERSLAEIEASDLAIFKRLQKAQLLDAIMPAHVIYPNVDDKPAGFSEFWLEQVLRNDMQFSGVIFSDDLGMQAAHMAGGMPERVQFALQAGCDMALVCNDRLGAIAVLDTLKHDKQTQESYSSRPQSLIKAPSLILDQGIYNKAKSELTKLLSPLSEFGG